MYCIHSHELILNFFIYNIKTLNIFFYFFQVDLEPVSLTVSTPSLKFIFPSTIPNTLLKLKCYLNLFLIIYYNSSISTPSFF